MEGIIFDNTVIQKSALYPIYAKTLQEISHRDYPNRYIFDTRINCLDIDTYEKTIHKSNANNTVDAVIGICTCTNDKRKTAPRLLLIELRMDYKSTRNLSATQMNKKVKYTKELLGADILLDKNNYFIFDKSVIYQMKRWFATKASEIADFKNNQAWSVEDFCSNIVSYDDLPYKALNDTDIIMQNFQSLIDQKNWIGLFSSLRYWIDKAGGYKYSNIREFQNIVEVICMGWQNFELQEPQLNENEELERIILKEDIEVLLK